MADARNIIEEQLAKSGGRLPTALPWQLLIFSFIFLGAAVAVYLGMDFGYKPFLNSQIKSLDAKINNLGNAVNQDQQNSLINLYSQLTNIKGILKSHVMPSKLFDELEADTQSQIYYSELDLSLSQNKLGLKGFAPDYNALAQQLDLFKKSAMFSGVLLENAKLANNEINFSIQLLIAPDSLK